MEKKTGRSRKDNRRKQARSDSDIDRYKAKIVTHRLNRIKRVGIALLALVIVVGVSVFIVQRRTYQTYSVLGTVADEDTIATNYEELGKNVLKYSTNGAALVNAKQDVVWNQTYEMQNPKIDICNEAAAVYDEKGTSIYMFTKDGPTGAVDTSLPILKTRVAENGVVAAILEDGEKTWINFDAADGSTIAENQTRIDSPGYPVDLAVSPNGRLIMVSYLYIEGGAPTSYVAYYNFGDMGQSKIDNIVSGFTYDVLVPEVAYLNEDTSLAFREDGFSTYRGKEVPKEGDVLKVEKEIVSTFHDSKHIGMVFKSDKEDKQYSMELYAVSGRLLFKKDFNIEYKKIKISNDMILMFNDTQVCMMNMNGVEKFNGTIDEGSIQNMFKIASNRYTVVTDSGIHTIKFK